MQEIDPAAPAEAALHDVLPAAEMKALAVVEFKVEHSIQRAGKLPSPAARSAASPEANGKVQLQRTDCKQNQANEHFSG